MSIKLSSGFACYIQTMLDIRENSGFNTDYLKRHLQEFDCFCVNNHVAGARLDKDLAESWALLAKEVSPWEKNRRLITMRHLGEYLLTQGLDAYVCMMRIKVPKPKPPQLLDDRQLAEFFLASDSMEFCKRTPFRHLVAPVMLRLIYCCGLRSSEACRLQVGDFNLDSGLLMIKQSKRRKDRVVYLQSDILELCRAFDSRMQDMAPGREFFFPYLDGRGYVCHMVSRLFDKVLDQTSFSNTLSKKPTCHGLRHLFAVNSMKACMEQGRDFNEAIFYLSRYLGHEGPQQTLYYLHASPNIAGVIRKMASKLNIVIGDSWHVED